MRIIPPPKVGDNVDDWLRDNNLDSTMTCFLSGRELYDYNGSMAYIDHFRVVYRPQGWTMLFGGIYVNGAGKLAFHAGMYSLAPTDDFTRETLAPLQWGVIVSN